MASHNVFHYFVDADIDYGFRLDGERMREWGFHPVLAVDTVFAVNAPPGVNENQDPSTSCFTQHLAMDCAFPYSCPRA